MTRDESGSTGPRPEIDDFDSAHAWLFSHGALALLSELHARFAPAIDERLAERALRQRRFDQGMAPHFLEETRWLRAEDWTIRPPPADLQDRRVEITGPPDRAMVVNALNSGAQVFMADFEDSLAPTWSNVLRGQANVADAIRRQIDFTSEAGKEYRLGDDPAVLIVRTRGLHLVERHVRFDGRPMPGALFDFGLFVWHNARELLARDTGPYLYLPKLENHREARVWAEVLAFTEDFLELPRGTIRVTVLIETLPAVFEMDEILHELREWICGLNCGRWDYIFSFIKTFRAHPECVLPNRDQVTMDRHFLHAYSRLLIRTCHRRGAHAMGGMAAQIPVRGDNEATEAALVKVRADKEREAVDGHDGTWVAHPALVEVAREIFDHHMPAAHQVDRVDDGEAIGEADLLRVPDGTITETGVRGNLAVALRYLGEWLDGRGCVPINHLMEDAATAEIARAQIWQWLQHDTAVLEDGRRLTPHFVRELLQMEYDRLRADIGDAAVADGPWNEAGRLIDQLVTAPDLADFLTIPAYERLP